MRVEWKRERFSESLEALRIIAEMKTCLISLKVKVKKAQKKNSSEGGLCIHERCLFKARQ